MNVLITGISRGIGKALALKFLSEDSLVIGTSMDGTVDFSHENLKSIPLDLSNSVSIKDCVDTVKSVGLEIDILINNAGILVDDDGDPDINIDVLRKTLEVNLFGPIDFTQQLADIISPQGHVINISSRQGSITNTENSLIPSYKISKAGVNMFTRILAARFKDKFIVSSVHPGAVKTAMARPDANMEPEEAAEYIYKLAISKPETGQFWFKDEKFPW